MSETHQIIHKILSSNGHGMTAQEIRREFLRYQGVEFMEDSGFTARIRELRKFGIDYVCKCVGKKRWEYKLLPAQPQQ